MKLIGTYISPYTRRVAVTMTALGIPFEHESVRPSERPDLLQRHNPLKRIPILVLDDGEVLIESFAMLDALDDMVGPERALVPPHGAARRQVMRVVAAAVGTMDKTLWSFYEERFHPPEKVHQPWIEHNDGAAAGGLGYLDGLAAAVGPEGWLAGTPRMSQADISTTAAFTFAARVRPGLDVAGRFPALAAFVARCEAMDVFRACPYPD